MFLSKCTVCNGKKLNFIREQEASGLSNKLGIKTFSSKIHLFGDFLLFFIKGIQIIY